MAPSSNAPRRRNEDLDDVPRRPRPPRATPPLRDERESSGKRRVPPKEAVSFREASSGDDDDTETVVGEYVRHRDGRIDFKPTRTEGSKKHPPDFDDRKAARKKEIRARRDDYEVDEAEALRAAKRDKGVRHDPLDHYDLPDRTRPPLASENSVPAGPAAAATAGAATVGALGGYAAANSRKARRPPPEATRRRHDDYDDDYPPPRSRRPRRPPPDIYDDPGYASERPRRVARRDLDDDYASDRGPPRRSGGAARYDRRLRYDDDLYDDMGPPRRSRSARVGDRRPVGAPVDKADWKQQGIGLFKTHAMPVIRQEGGRFVRKELTKFLAQQGGR